MVITCQKRSKHRNTCIVIEVADNEFGLRCVHYLKAVSSYLTRFSLLL